MESLPKNRILSYHDDTLQYLRHQYGLDTVTRMNEAIDRLEEWINKQEHFEYKKFDRGFLERLVIYNKGSVEKCKKKLDRLCTLRTLIPDFFAIHKFKKEEIYTVYSDALLPKLTPDHGRVHFMKIVGQKFDTSLFIEYCKYFVLISKYIQMCDYCNHLIILVDWTEVNIIEFIKGTSISELRKCCEIAFEGFSMRLNAIHMLSASRAVDGFISILKQLMSAKLGARIHTHKSWDTILKLIPQDILPKEYGGTEKSIYELRDILFDELHSKEFTEYREEMNKARVNEAYRHTDKFNEEYMGTSGTFRNLTVD